MITTYLQRRTSLEIGGDHLLPAGALRLRNPGVSVAGKVGQADRAALSLLLQHGVEEVEGAGATRRVRDPDQLPATGERVDHRRLAHVAPADEGDLRRVGRRPPGLLHRG